MTTLYFKCTQENLCFSLETMIKPNVGETVIYRRKFYIVDKIIWNLQPQSDESYVVVFIKPKYAEKENLK